MADYTVQPNELLIASNAERKAWERRDDAEYTRRAMARKAEAGDIGADDLETAKREAESATTAWCATYEYMKNMLRAALTERGFDVATVVRIAKSMS